MNLRVTPRGWPNRRDLYGGVVAIRADGDLFIVTHRSGESWTLPFTEAAQIELDDEPGDWW